jgi:DNA-binding transcriptional MerR regulator
LTVTLSYYIHIMMKAEFTLEELAQAVRDWCEDHRLFPANGQASDEISERTIRYYRTLGLLDAPLGGYVKSFSEKHRLQLVAIRIYQTQGIPLRKIRDELYGRSQENLEDFVKQYARKGKAATSFNVPFTSPAINENWAMTPLSEEFMLISREGRQLPAIVIEKINRLIQSVYPVAETRNQVSKN